MVSRRHILFLLNGLAIWVAVLAVLGAFQGVAMAANNPLSGLALRWAALTISVLLCANLILLVIALAAREVQREQSTAADTLLDESPPEADPASDALGGETEPEIDLDLERRLGG